MDPINLKTENMQLLKDKPMIIPSISNFNGKSISPSTFQIKIIYAVNYTIPNTSFFGSRFIISIGPNDEVLFVIFCCHKIFDKPCYLSPKLIDERDDKSINVGQPIENGNIFTVEIKFTERKNVLGTAQENFISTKVDCDTYILTLPNLRNNNHPDYFYMNFHRGIWLDTTYISNVNLNKNLEITNQSVSIDIVSQTLIDGSDVGETIFSIVILNKITINKNCPKMVSVFIGDAKVFLL